MAVRLITRGFFRIGCLLLGLKVALLVVDVGLVGAQEESPLAKRFFAEAPQAWERQMEFFLTLDSTGQVRRRERSNANEEWRIQLSRFTSKQCDRGVFSQIDNLEPKPWSGSIQIENPDYSFTLTRSTESKPWVIQELKKNTNEKCLTSWQHTKFSLQDLTVCDKAPILPQLVRQAEFKCISIVLEPTDGEELARLTFSFTPSHVVPVRGGWFLLDPSHNWVIRQSDIDLDYGKQMTGKVATRCEYKEGSNHRLIMTKCVKNSKTWQEGRVIVESEVSGDVDSRERPSIPENEFKLSAFGLPEPQWLTHPQTKRNWYAWFGILGLICLTIGASIHWLKKRQTVKAP